MTKQERIFDAIGGVDAELLARSERTARRHRRHWVVWGAAAAACMVLVLQLWRMLPKSPDVEPSGPVISSDFWGEGQRAHFLALRVPQVMEQSGPQFYLYVDEERYYACRQDGVYVVRPIGFPDTLPECVMEVSHMDAAPDQAAEAVYEELQNRYASVTEIRDVTDGRLPANTLHCFVASDGVKWDDAQRETFLVSDGKGGVFVVSYGYFMEAAEGHGVRFAGMAATFHVLQSPPQFYLPIDEEVYDACRQDGMYVVRPKNAPENLPACVMEISHMSVTPAQAAKAVRGDLESRYGSVSEITEFTQDIAWKLPSDTLRCFIASDGVAWNDAQRETFLVDDGQGGVFVVSYGYFMEATEGHGTRFARMAAEFQVVRTDDAPAWLAELDESVERLMRGVFSGELENAADLLLPDAEVDKYGAGTAEDVVIHSIDKAVNDETAPTAALVRIPYSLSPEEPGGTLVMELTYVKDSNRWLALRIGLEQ